MMLMTEQSPEQPAATTTTSPPRRWLERLKINKFRSVEPGTELHFSDGLHVVLGKNATGKSTLLDLIAAALDLNFDHPRFREEEIDLEFVLRAGPFEIEAAVKRVANPERPRGAAQNRDASERSILEEGRYTFRAASGLEVTLHLSNDDLPRRTVKGVDSAHYGLDQPLGWRDQSPPLSPQLRLIPGQWFQGSLKKPLALGTLLGKDVFSIGGNDRCLLRVPESDELLLAIEADDFEICLGQSLRSCPSLLPEKIFKTLPNDGSPLNISFADEPILAAFVTEMGFDEARMFLGPPRVEQRYGSETFVYSSPTFTFYRNGHMVRRGDQLSYGQRRLFALGWYLICNREVAILDEPSNGLHESWVDFLVSQLGNRQVFLTSQNRETLDMLPFRTEAELSHAFVLCESRAQPSGGEPTLHWRGLRDDESALMMKAFRASRVDLVTDLLRGLNLW
jgi:energy-coupling factor transporter ATP-binding protein EcfA2